MSHDANRVPQRSPGRSFPILFDRGGVFRAHATLDGTSVGALVVNVMHVDFDGPIACQVGFTREKGVVVYGPADGVVFTAQDPALLEVSVKETTPYGVRLYLRPLGRGTPVLQARLGTATGPIIAEQEIDEFTFEDTAADFVILTPDEEGGGKGTTRIVMRPLVVYPDAPAYDPVLHSTIATSGACFADGGTALQFSTSALTPVFDDATGETVGVIDVDIYLFTTYFCKKSWFWQKNNEGKIISNVKFGNGNSYEFRAHRELLCRRAAEPVIYGEHHKADLEVKGNNVQQRTFQVSIIRSADPTQHKLKTWTLDVGDTAGGWKEVKSSTQAAAIAVDGNAQEERPFVDVSPVALSHGGYDWLVESQPLKGTLERAFYVAIVDIQAQDARGENVAETDEDNPGVVIQTTSTGALLTLKRAGVPSAPDTVKYLTWDTAMVNIEDTGTVLNSPCLFSDKELVLKAMPTAAFGMDDRVPVTLRLGNYCADTVTLIKANIDLDGKDAGGAEVPDDREDLDGAVVLPAGELPEAELILRTVGRTGFTRRIMWTAEARARLRIDGAVEEPADLVIGEGDGEKRLKITATGNFAADDTVIVTMKVHDDGGTEIGTDVVKLQRRRARIDEIAARPNNRYALNDYFIAQRNTVEVFTSWELRFEGSLTPDDPAATYTWQYKLVAAADFTDFGTAGKTMTHTENAPGNYLVRLKVTTGGADLLSEARAVLVAQVTMTQFELEVPKESCYTKTALAILPPELTSAIKVSQTVAYADNPPANVSKLKHGLIQGLAKSATGVISGNLSWRQDSRTGDQVKYAPSCRLQHSYANMNDAPLGKYLYGPTRARDIGEFCALGDTPDSAGPRSSYAGQTLPAYAESGVAKADVTYGITSFASDEEFMVWGCIFNEETNQYVPLKQQGWRIILDWAQPGPWRPAVTGTAKDPSSKPTYPGSSTSWIKDREWKTDPEIQATKP